MNKLQICLMSMLSLVLLTGAACSQSQVLTTLSAIVSSAEIALPVIGEATGTPPATIEAISKYLRTVGIATAAAADILAGPGSTAEKSALIAKAFAGIANGCNCIPAGTPSRVVAVVDAVARSVLAFLANFPQSGARQMPGAAEAVEIKPGEQKELVELRKRSEAIIGAIERKGVK